jgi:uncharacterized protein YcnI
MRLLHRLNVLFALICLTAAVAPAHVSIWPRESSPGATEKYVVRIPSEGKVATTGVDIEFPEGVIFETIAAPMGWKYELKRKDDRVAAITLQVDVKPGEFIEVAFVARNPRGKDQLVWTLRQRFADGTMSDWTNGPNGIRPTAVTKLASVGK